VVGAVAVGLDEEATLYGRGNEEYGEAGNYGQPENYGAPRNYDRTGNSSPEGADYGRRRDGNGGRRSGPRHAAAKQRG
jgi:hypothetical protein